MYPLLVRGQSEPRAEATPSRAKGRNRRRKTIKATPRTENTESRWTKKVSPARPLPGRLAHTSGVSHPRTHGLQQHQLHWARAREAPPWWHADLCEDKEYSRSDEGWKAMILDKILAEETRKTPGKILVGDGSTPRQDPCRATRQDPCWATRQDPCQRRQQGHCQARTNQASTAVRMQLPAQPAGQAPAWQHAASRPTQHTPAWRHADLREGSTTAPPQLPACLHGAACITDQGAC